MIDPTKDIKKEDLLKPLTGKKLKEYNTLEDQMSIKQCKMSRTTMKGLLHKKQISIGRLYKKSKTSEGQAKYKKWQKEVTDLEKECYRWTLTINKKQKIENERKNKKT